MSRKLQRGLAMAVVAVLAVVPLAACKQKPASVKTVWPKVSSERQVPQPKGKPKWPLTGLDAPSDAATHQRVVSVKIENSSASRPQFNLFQADVIYETLTEGGITRFNAIFHSKAPDRLGPVRSARLSDLHIVPEYGALFVFAGASSSTNAAMRRTDIQNLSADIGVSRIYTRSKDRPAPHNLYTSVPLARQEGKLRRFPTTQSIRSFPFDYSGTEPTATVRSIGIVFSEGYSVEWRWDAATKTYLRFNNGVKHFDAANGKQYSGQNVVVMWAKTVTTTHRDVAGSRTLDITLSGKGRATVFRQGVKYDGEWEADAKTHTPPVFRAKDGTLIRLTPGQTWMEVIPTTTNITMR